MYEELPTYTLDPPPPAAPVPPPTYSPPTTFTIGSQTTPVPLVSIAALKGHLGFLHAFYTLKLSVEGDAYVSVGMGNGVPGDKERRWGWFVGLAVERFDIWCRNLEYGVDFLNDWTTVIPPVDVLMVWHAYMLNPRWYGEDAMRGPLRALRQLDRHFATVLSTDTHEFLTANPSPARIAFFEGKTNTAFDHVYSGQCLVAKDIQCPLCSHTFTVDYMDRFGRGKGYLQHGFNAPCPKYCGIQDVTREKLAVRRLAMDIAAPKSTPELFLAGTNFRPTTIRDRHFSTAACERVLEAAGVKTPTTTATFDDAVTSILVFSGYSLEKLRSTMDVSGPDRLSGRIMSAYNDDKPYSLDLVGAVLRQASFVQKMYNLGWTKQGFFEGADNEIVLHHGMARYHGFLDLLSAFPSALCVPTLDIDLVWHTHQLYPTKYMQDTINYVRRYIDHDDKIEGLRLSKSFEMTCKIWKERFGIAYTHCGCPHAGQKAEDLQDPHSIGKRISRIFSSKSESSSSSSSSNNTASNLYSGSNNTTTNGSAQHHPGTFKTLLIPSPDRADALTATHPSDHNAVRFGNKGVTLPTGFDAGKYRHERMSKKYDSLMKQRKKQAEKLERRRMVLAQKAGKVGAIQRVPPHAPGGDGGGSGGGSLKTSKTRNTNANGTTASPYDTVFLAPVPLYYGPTYVGPIGGCVPAYGGIVQSPVSGCGNCGSGGSCGGGCGNGGMDNSASGHCSSGGSACGGGGDWGGAGCGGCGGCGG